MISTQKRLDPHTDHLRQRARQLVREAFQLFNTGHNEAAAMTARAAMEVQLGVVCRTDPRISSGKGSRSWPQRRLLVASGVIDTFTAAQLHRLHHVGSQACHGLAVPVERVALLLVCVKTLLSWSPVH